MFYYPNVLQRHSGCFATIWLAATGGTRLVKREYLKVDVVETCEKILQYILVQVQPPLPGIPRPRFSLYLSAQLQFGVIRVYFRQCQYLVEDIQHILERLHRAQQQIRIDMMEPEVPGLLLPDPLTTMEALEDAPDPFFGVMAIDPSLPSPLHIPQVRHLLEAPTPERIPKETPPQVYPQPTKADISPITVLPPETITLLEAEPIHVLHIEGEQDLPEISHHDLDLLMAAEDEAILSEEKAKIHPPQELQIPHVPDAGVSVEIPRVPEQEIIPRLSPAAEARIQEVAEPLLEKELVPEELGLLVPEAAPPPPEEIPTTEILLPRMPSPLEPPVQVPSSPELILPELAPPPQPPPSRRRPRMQLYDEETQITREEFQKQVVQTQAHTRDCPMVQPSRQMKSPTELLRTPVYAGWLHPELLGLWTRCARVPPKELQYPRPQELESVVEQLEERRKAETISEIETLREAQEPTGPMLLSSELSLETTEEERSRLSFIPPEERWGLGEAEVEVPALPVVPELPELPELPLQLAPDVQLLSPEAVQRAIMLELQVSGEMDFNNLIPPFAPRLVAARVFYLLLVLSMQQVLHVEQEEPYGSLLIRPGPRYHHH